MFDTSSNVMTENEKMNAVDTPVMKVGRRPDFKVSYPKAVNDDKTVWINNIGSAWRFGDKNQHISLQLDVLPPAGKRILLFEVDWDKEDAQREMQTPNI